MTYSENVATLHKAAAKANRTLTESEMLGLQSDEFYGSFFSQTGEVPALTDKQAEELIFKSTTGKAE